ncbi:unnamed protein product [Leuciscus chuanchicus]
MATLEEVGQMNTASLLSSLKNWINIDAFLHNDTTIPFPSSLVDPHAFDFDGLVIQLTELLGLEADFHYINLPRIEQHHLRAHWSNRKKHVQLRNCSSSGVDALRCSQRITLARVDGGYFLNLTVMTRDMRHPYHHTTKTHLAKENAIEFVNNMTETFKTKLRNLQPRDLARPTVLKNNLCNLALMNKKDRRFILQLLDESIDQVTASYNHLTILKTLSIFGQKDDSSLALSRLVDLAHVQSMSIHAACTLTAKDPSTHLLWSRYGLQELVGHRGRLYTALSIHEAVNYQSKLDCSDMDISEESEEVKIEETFKVKHEDTEEQTKMLFIKEESEEVKVQETFSVKQEETEEQTDLVPFKEESQDLNEMKEKDQFKTLHDVITEEKYFSSSQTEKTSSQKRAQKTGTMEDMV